MGNCQANDAAVAVIQLADGRVERLYWPTTAEEVMRSHPGCYVAKVTLCISGERPSGAPATATTSGVRFTRVRLLRHKDILVYGQVYRLITSQEVAKALRERRQEKLRKAQSELGKQQKMTIQHHLLHLQQSTGVEDDAADSKQTDQVIRHEREKQRSSRYWRPSLQSISEIGN
ncbi:hypothetical protein HPP92_016434 [Vanilla planifolia]|uniref:Uncharacterized protein n=1 Tax=Vanilla planifolia TaxID=51239 RepID=A0A835QNN7_VANPL|nr:hypothetical protein HPP92_016434 [Vanilla planifolia]